MIADWRTYLKRKIHVQKTVLVTTLNSQFSRNFTIKPITATPNMKIRICTYVSLSGYRNNGIGVYQPHVGIFKYKDLTI